MTRYVAFLRGINVSGHKKIRMADLRSELSLAGLSNVQTYIQSGNIVFDYSGTSADARRVVFEVIKSNYGWEVPVLVKTASDLNSILTACPFSQEKMEKSYFILLSESSDIKLAQEIQKGSTEIEEFFITSNCVYIYYALGAGKAKLGTNWFERKLKVIATARNFRTMAKLSELVSS